MIIYDLLDTNEDILPGLTCGQASAWIIRSVKVRALQHRRLTATFVKNYSTQITPISPPVLPQVKTKKKGGSCVGPDLPLYPGPRLAWSPPATNMIAVRLKTFQTIRDRRQKFHIRLIICCHCVRCSGSE